MEVLDYTYNDLYRLEVKSAKDIYGSWKKFRVRANTIRPEEYCSYECRTGGSLRVFNCDNSTLEDVVQENWEHARPVFFETNVYSFCLRLFKVKEGTEPRMMHQDKSVEDLFTGFWTSDGYVLNGNIDFLNQPGRFSFRFAFTSSDGSSHEECISFDVVSPKMDTKHDLNVLIKELKSEYDDLVFRYLTLTCQQFSLGKEVNNDLIWLSIFRNVVNSYVAAVRYILFAPHNKDFINTEFKKPDRIKKWSNQLSERFKEDESENAERAYASFYRVEQTESTNDTIENRFVKYSIDRICERLEKVVRKIKTQDASASEVSELEDSLKALDALRRNALFRGVGRFQGFRQESMVLQQRNGYAQVYRFWILLQNGLNLIHGETSVGVQPIWKLYVLWCFLKVKRLVADVLGLDLHNPADLAYVDDKSEKHFDPFNGGDLTGSVIYTNRDNGDRIEVGYQYSFSQKGSGIRSVTVEQKPDIVMHIHKKSGITLTYLFDAKYRVLGDDDSASDSVIDYPVEDTLNQMHRYRDAIYYSDGDNKGFAKEIVGGYILFPGRLNEKDYLSRIEAGEYDKLPYFLKSIEYVNIGAFPLLPNEGSGLLLRSFLERIIVGSDANAQIEDSIPQRGMYYSLEDEGVSVIVGCVKNDAHHDWILANMKYNLRLDKNRKGAVNLKSDYANAKYLVLYRQGDTHSDEIYRLTGDYDVMTSDELSGMGYPEPGGKMYLVLGIEDSAEEVLKSRGWDLSSDLIDTSEGSPRLIKYVNLLPPEWVENI